MDALQHWTDLRTIVEQALRTTNYCALATVGADGSPHVAPIGSLFFLEAGKGFYFEKFPRNTRVNLEHDQRLCILAMQRGFRTFMKALFTGSFESAPGVRLYGCAGARRPATTVELQMWRERIKPFRYFKRLKGYRLLWEHMDHVREVTVDTFEPVRFGAMTQGLFQEAG
jgi:uncharacterized protein